MISFFRGVLRGVFTVSAALAAFVAHADTTRTQTVSLHKGWNAVQLQVTPAVGGPSDVFAGTPVTIAATYFGANNSAQFIQNPTATEWKKEGWGVWYAPSRTDGFLSTLNAVAGNRAYLIYSKQDFTWNVTGEVKLSKVHWKSDAFTLVGFSLDPLSPPTFDKFFSGSSAHRPCRIYQLVNDQWTLVANPIQQTMNSGEAYWVYCKGGSDFQGPLKASAATGRLALSGSPAEVTLALANQGLDPMNVTVQTISNDGGLPLSYCIRGVTTSKISDLIFNLPAVYPLPTIESGASTGLYLRLRREDMTAPAQSELLKISTDSGVQMWIPITGTRDALTSAATP
jgi:hypothetical protein